MTLAFTPDAGCANGMASAIPKVATDPARSAAAKNAFIDCPLIWPQQCGNFNDSRGETGQ
jgi:hypothetical protein